MNGYDLAHDGDVMTLKSAESDLYPCQVFIGEQTVELGQCGSIWSLSREDRMVRADGLWDVHQEQVRDLSVLICGYRPPYRAARVDATPRLPYINGCSTAQLLPPIRPGDPTWQMLHMPPHTSEQRHHIHSTARIVYVWEGAGTAIIGQGDQAIEVPLNPGDTLILHCMVPHHFQTGDSPLLVLPLHVFSTSPGIEHHHPMMAGTHMI